MSDFDGRPKNSDALSVEHLRAFIALVDHKTQVQASEWLGIGQSTIARRIEHVQEHFGRGLFESGNSGPVSSRGRIVAEAARSVLGTLARTRERLAERPVLRIGFIRLARPLLENALHEQRSERQALPFDVRLFEMTSEAQARALGRDELDVAIGFDIPDLVARADVETSIVAELRYALVLPERACLKGKPSARILRTLSHVHPPRRYAKAIVDAADRWLAAHDIVPERALEQASATELIAYAAAGHGFGFLPELWRTMASAGVAFAKVPDYEATARIAVCSLRHVAPHVSALRTSLEASARAALE